MKQILSILSCFTFILLLAACGGNSGSADSSSTTATTSTTPETTPAAKEMLPGEKLINTSDCIGCHNKTEKVVGPAYVDVAAKYKATDKNIAMLAGKIINGGKGNWGDIPMTAHAGLSTDDAKEMVKYILSLKK